MRAFLPSYEPKELKDGWFIGPLKISINRLRRRNVKPGKPLDISRYLDLTAIERCFLILHYNGIPNYWSGVPEKFLSGVPVDILTLTLFRKARDSLLHPISSLFTFILANRYNVRFQNRISLRSLLCSIYLQFIFYLLT